MAQRNSNVTFLQGCFSGKEWSFLNRQWQFREHVDRVNSNDEAEALVSLGLELLDEAEERRMAEAVGVAAAALRS